MSPLNSMTGFGQAELENALGRFRVEIKSVNHRYLESRIHLPRNLSHLEMELTKTLKAALHRGKVDASVWWQPAETQLPKVHFNPQMLAYYDEQLREAGAEAGLNAEVSLEYLLGLPGVCQEDQAPREEDELAQALADCLQEALKKLQDERRREGQQLEEELAGRLEVLEKTAGAIEERREVVQKKYRDRLLKKVEEWTRETGSPVEPGRMESEVLFVAERADITEELVRLTAHIQAFREKLGEGSGGPVGKPLEFLSQELLRETNTIASKSRDTDIASDTLRMKNEIEKIREQVMNVE